MDKKIIGVFCGSFNPPLFSHLLLAEEQINNGLNKVVFVPVNSKYHKKGLISNEHRYNMLKLVCDTNSKFEVSDIEINSEEWMRTFHTLTALQKQYSDSEIRLIIGTDNLKELYWWYEIEKILENFKIIVLARAEDNVDDIIANDNVLARYKDRFISSNMSIKTNLSSTYVRDLFKNGKQARYLLPDAVIDYIYENNLYVE